MEGAAEVVTIEVEVSMVADLVAVADFQAEDFPVVVEALAEAVPPVDGNIKIFMK